MALNNCLITTFTITERENLTGEHRVKVSIGIRSYPVPLPDQSFEDYFWGLNPYIPVYLSSSRLSTILPEACSCPPEEHKCVSLAAGVSAFTSVRDEGTRERRGS